MCEPTTIIGGAALLAGTALQYRAQQQRERDMKGLQRRESERQEDIHKQTKPLFDQNLEEYRRGNVESEMAAAATKRAAAYDAQGASAPRANATLPGSSQTTNSVVNDAFSRALESAQARASATGQARAKLSSFGDVMNTAALDNNKRTDQLGMLGSFSQGSASVLPLELQRAATRTRGAATAGNLLTTIGGAMLSGGALGAAGGAASAGSAGAAAAGSTAGAAAGAGAAGGAAGVSGMGAGLTNWAALFGL